jgi:hypothetical protein
MSQPRGAEPVLPIVLIKLGTNTTSSDGVQSAGFSRQGSAPSTAGRKPALRKAVPCRLEGRTSFNVLCVESPE